MPSYDNGDLQNAEDWKYILLVGAFVVAVIAVAGGVISLLL